MVPHQPQQSALEGADSEDEPVAFWRPECCRSAVIQGSQDRGVAFALATPDVAHPVGSNKAGWSLAAGKAPVCSFAFALLPVASAQRASQPEPRPCQMLAMLELDPPEILFFRPSPPHLLKRKGSSHPSEACTRPFRSECMSLQGVAHPQPRYFGHPRASIIVVTVPSCLLPVKLVLRSRKKKGPFVPDQVTTITSLRRVRNKKELMPSHPLPLCFCFHDLFRDVSVSFSPLHHVVIHHLLAR